MKQPIVLIAFLLFSSVLKAQDSISKLPDLKNEFGMSLRGSMQHIYFQLGFPKLNSSELPEFFPKKDQPSAMNHTEENYFSNMSYQFSYTRWSGYKGKENRNKYGMSFIFGANDGCYFNEYWSNQTRVTFDSITSQSNGETYPVDSVYHHFYDRKTTMSFLQLGLGGKFSTRISNKMDFQLGLKGIVDVKVEESTLFRYSLLTSIETYNQHSNVSKESGIVQSELSKKTSSDFFSMNVSIPILFSYNFTFPQHQSQAEMIRKRMIMERRGRKVKETFYAFRFGVEPVLTMVSMNNTFYSKPAFLTTFGSSIFF